METNTTYLNISYYNGNHMNRYLKLYGWMWEAFGRRQFSLGEFNSVFPSPQAKKVMHDLISGGYLERIERGGYKVKEPNTFISGIVNDNLEGENILPKSERTYAFCCNDAVTAWTDGYYFSGFTKGFKPIHIEILEKDSEYWRRFFIKNSIEYMIDGESRTLFGLTYILHPVKSIKSEDKDGSPVVSLDETVRFCQENELTYRPALEYLDNKFHLKLFKEYQHINT